MRYQGYQCSGKKGTVRQLIINGQAVFHDSVIEDGDGKAVNKLERTLGDAIHYEKSPLFGDFDQEQMEDYCGA